MNAQADDRIYWCSTDAHVPKTFTGLAHLCPTALAIVQTTRESLDPMALGTCRYCGERLPVPPHKETEQSAPSS